MVSCQLGFTFSGNANCVTGLCWPMRATLKNFCSWRFFEKNNKKKRFKSKNNLLSFRRPFRFAIFF